MAEFLSRFVTRPKDNRSFSFIWVAPRKLHNQSKEKLEKIYKHSRALECLVILKTFQKTKINE